MLRICRGANWRGHPKAHELNSAIRRERMTEPLLLELKAAVIGFDFPLCSETTHGFLDGPMAAIKNVCEVADAVAPMSHNGDDCR